MNSTLNLPPYGEDEIRALLAKKRKIEAIKRVRELSGASLKEAKDYVDRLEQDPIYVSDFGDFQQTPPKLSFEEVLHDYEGEIRDLLRHKRKIEAVKRVRKLSGTGLKESKDFVDQIQKDMLL